MYPFYLKPCVCGGVAEWEYTPWDDETGTGDDGSGWIECKKCGFCIHDYYREGAEASWNKLVTTDESVK